MKKRRDIIGIAVSGNIRLIDINSFVINQKDT
jgi:hypothetical protein